MSKVMEEVHLTTIKPKNNVLLLAQEISFAKVLACNDKRLRDRGVRRLKKWFMARSQGSMEFTKDDLLRIWKGLFYCMWMSDKPLIQEELAEQISSLIHSFATFKSSLMFVEAFFTSLSVEWFGIDQLRMDKFMMLVRRFLRQSLELVARQNWNKEQVGALAEVYEKTLASAPMGLSMHFIEIFCEELAKVGKGELSSEIILLFITPFARIMANLKDGRLISQITRYVFLHLIRQTELGIEHQMKFSVWKEHGFAGGNLDAVEKVEVDSDSDNDVTMEDDSEGEEEEERQVGLDARAGKVDVLLPPLDFDPNQLLTALVELRNKKETTTKARKTLIQLISKFENLAAGKYPLGLHKVELPKKVDKKKEITKAAKRLIVDEQRMIYSDSEDSVDSPKGKRKEKRKKMESKKQKSSVWEVSDSESNMSHNESISKTCWDVSEIEENKDMLKTDSSKHVEEDSSEQKRERRFFTEKIMKTSSFTVSESKENSFASPVASTPKSMNKSNVLKKLSPNNQNVCNTPTNNDSINESRNSIKQKQKSKANNSSSINTTNTKKRKQSPKNKALKLVDDQSNTNSNSGSSNSNKEDDKEVSADIQLNTSSTEKNNGWGGDWEEPSKDVEYEIFIPNKKYVEKRKSLGLSFPTSSFFQKSVEKVTPLKRTRQNSTLTPGSQKKVEFNLSANCSQEYKDYTKKLKRSKSQVPFDAAKKPVQGLLKNSTPSPINPFYKKKLKLLSSSFA